MVNGTNMRSQSCYNFILYLFGKNKNNDFSRFILWGGGKRLSILIEANDEKNLTGHICAVILTNSMILFSISEKYVILGNP